MGRASSGKGRSEPLAESEELTIGDAAARIGVATSTLRFYESKGLIVSRRTDSGQRRYARDVLRRVAFVRAAQSVGLSLGEIETWLSGLPADRAPSREEWADFGTQWRPRLEEQIATLEAMRDKLSNCIGCGCLSLEVCRLFNPGDQAAGEGSGAPYLLRSDATDGDN